MTTMFYSGTDKSKKLTQDRIMNTHAVKTTDNKSQSVADTVSQKQGNGGALFQFEDNRSEATVQRKLQKMVNGSSKVSQLKTFHDIANSSPKARHSTQLQSKTDNHSVQQKQPIQKKENNTGLPDNLKTGMENLSGISLDNVKVHHNSEKPAQLQAHAYAQGTDIHLGPGQEKHLPHEVWHVVQQKQGRVKPTMQMKGKINVNDDKGLEKEADVMGEKALQMQKNEQNSAPSTLPKNDRSESGRLEQAHSEQKITPVLQGKFGFEIETKLILSAGAADADTADKSAFTKPDAYLDSFPKVAKGDGFKVHLDHTGSFKSVVEGGPIAEMVTDPPINEATQSEDEAARIAQNMADAATSMGAAPAIPSKLSLKSKINSVDATGADIYVGYPGAGGQSTYGYVQATFGAKLAAIPKMLTHMAKPEMATSPKAGNIFTAAVADASSVTERLRVKFSDAMGNDNYGLSDAWTIHHSDEHDRDFHYHKESATSQWNAPTNAEQVTADFKQLEGFLALVLQYLIAGRDYGRGDVPTNLLKNAIGQFFYKTKLSTLVNKMQGWARYIVKTPEWRAEVKKEVLAECGRNPNEYMSRAMTEKGFATIQVGTWLDNIFSGAGDNIFSDSINPWSAELVDEVGTTGHEAPSAVVENRRVNPLGGPKKFGPGVTPQQMKGWMKPDEWPALARYYHKMVTALNATDPQAPPESVAPEE